MRKKNTSIPINSIVNEFSAGIAIERTSFKTLPNFEEAKQSHREDRHTFFLLENGTVHIEIDFQTYIIKPSSVIYMHPNQVHRIIEMENVTVSTWAINNENLNPDYLRLLEGITPAKPLALDKETFSIIFELVSLCLKFSERKNDRLYHSLEGVGKLSWGHWFDSLQHHLNVG
ncbi:AraC family ligand binding domain-containing protein [Spirosoma flavum]|uniref:AraC family ligand binding domain-containing protein n=1 Tax=Spirosoma flavum TaxID=2048557 RepID=A0ABW6APY1_9BACT